MASSFVFQDDLFVETLTAEEHLNLAVGLRLPDLPKAERRRRVASLLQQMALAKCAKTRIGSPASKVKGLSGGERKRLSFASAVVKR